MGESIRNYETLLVSQTFKISDEIIDYYGRGRDPLNAHSHALAYALTQYQYANLQYIQSSDLEVLSGWMFQVARWKEVLDQTLIYNWEPARLAIQEDGRGFINGGSMEDDELGTAFLNLAWSLADNHK